MRTASGLSIHAGLLRMSIAGNGSIGALTDTVTGRDYLFRKRGSALLTLRVFGDKRIRKPIRMCRLDSGATRAGELRLALAYAGGVTLEVAIAPARGYAHPESAHTRSNQLAGRIDT